MIEFQCFSNKTLTPNKKLDKGGLKLEKHLVQLEIISSVRNL